MQRKACRAKPVGAPRPKRLGDQIRADHIVFNNDLSIGVGQFRYAIVIADRATRWVECYPLKDKTHSSAKVAFSFYLGPRSRCRLLWTDKSRELIAMAESLCIPHGTSTPYRPETNGIAERAVRSVLEGTRTILEAAGFPPAYWPLACQAFCFLTNVVIRDGDSSWYRRHGHGHFKGALRPVGAWATSALRSLPRSRDRRPQVYPYLGCW